MWNLISNNSFLGALASGFILLVLGWLVGWVLKWRRSVKIYKLLKTGLTEKNRDFLPTAYLAAKSGYTQSQVESFCSYHKNIRRNEKEWESWRIV